MGKAEVEGEDNFCRENFSSSKKTYMGKIFKNKLGFDLDLNQKVRTKVNRRYISIFDKRSQNP